MSLSQKAEKVASEFVLSDDDVRKCTKQFVFELGKKLTPLVPHLTNYPIQARG